MVEKALEDRGHIMVVKFFNKYIQPFLAIFIFVFLIIIINGLYDYKSLQKEISENCGWQEETYRCYCEKSVVLDIESVAMNYPSMPNISLQDLND